MQQELQPIMWMRILKLTMTVLPAEVFGQGAEADLSLPCSIKFLRRYGKYIENAAPLNA